MKLQEKIIRDCKHPGATSEVRLTDGSTVNCCCECWNASVYARRAAQKADNAVAAAEGAAWWAARGIKVGDKVTRVAVSMLGPMFGSMRVVGKAKAGRNGAYVTCGAQRGQLAPEGWEKA